MEDYLVLFIQTYKETSSKKEGFMVVVVIEGDGDGCCKVMVALAVAYIQ